MSFPRALIQRERQTAVSRIWTQVIESISDDDNRYAISASELTLIFIQHPTILTDIQHSTTLTDSQHATVLIDIQHPTILIDIQLSMVLIDI